MGKPIYTPNKSEAEQINRSTAEERRTHAIEIIAEWEELFILQNTKGEVAYATVDDYLLLPLWPAKFFADQSREGHWKSFTATSYAIEDFFNLIEKEEEGEEFITEDDQEFVFLISVHPTGEKSGFVLSVEEFMRDLLFEMRKYE